MFTKLLDKIKSINIAGYFLGVIIGSFIVAGVAAFVDNPPLPEFKDGILRIALENIVPEQKKPRKIEIGVLPQFAEPHLLKG